MTFEARLTELNIQEVLYYLNYRSQGIDDALMRQIQDCIHQIEKASKPKLTYKIVDVVDGKILDFEILGNDLKELLKDASKAFIFCATIGNDIERLLFRNEILNMANAVIMDSVASVAIENICNNLENDVRKQMEKEGYFVSDRFSCGYGDCPLSLQKQFCAYLNTEKYIGVHVTDSYIMTPRKSVTAIMSISKTPFTLRKSGCEVCSMFMSCTYRKAGKHCGK